MALTPSSLLLTLFLQVPFLGPDGEPLPFDDEDAVVEFLKTARVSSEQVIEEGVNGASRVLLELDGVRAHAVFRTVDLKRENLRLDDRTFPEFVDSYRYETAAYEVARLLGIGKVPPAVRRTLGERSGSLQLWIERTLEQTDPDFRPPDARRWVRQLWSMYLFDNLVFNVDRNSGNILVDSRYELWLVDHTRAFQVVPELLDERVIRIERAVWDRLVAAREGEFRERLMDHLKPVELDALLKRRERLLAQIKKLVTERGEALVFY